ncbi:MAG: carboxypeptidase-like regulatory domain-containing protein [Algoriphagus sp.]|jgi:hypothetical protein|nr:carboxypeptidase-like regulatory domain-containing protein [Algoriphagus sp.]
MINFLLSLFLFLDYSDYINGRVIDTEGNPIPSVLVKSGDQYTVTNSQGQFTIVLDSQRILVFQAMGYGIQEFNINEMKGKDEFTLHPIIFELPEIEILALNPRDIVEKARGKLFFSYHVVPSRTTYEFGNLIQVQTEEVISTGKRFLLVDRQLAHIRKSPEFFLIDGQDGESGNLEESKFEIGPIGLRLINRFFYEGSTIPDFLDSNLMDNYEYEIIEETALHYIVSAKSLSNRLHEDGILWIEREGFLIDKLILEKNEKGKKGYFKGVNLKMSPVSGKSFHLIKDWVEFDLVKIEDRQIISQATHIRMTQVKSFGKIQSEFLEQSRLNLLQMKSKESKDANPIHLSDMGNLTSLFQNYPLKGDHRFTVTFDPLQEN